jgi:hypothetical protein
MWPRSTPPFLAAGFAKDAIPLSKHPMKMTGSSPVMTGWRHVMGLAAGAVSQQQRPLA